MTLRSWSARAAGRRLRRRKIVRPKYAQSGGHRYPQRPAEAPAKPARSVFQAPSRGQSIIRNEQVSGSSPLIGSMSKRSAARFSKILVLKRARHTVAFHLGRS